MVELLEANLHVHVFTTIQTTSPAPVVNGRVMERPIHSIEVCRVCGKKKRDIGNEFYGKGSPAPTEAHQPNEQEQR